MNGGDLKKAAAAAANGTAGKKRRKASDLKPIITNEESDPATMSSTQSVYTLLPLFCPVCLNDSQKTKRRAARLLTPT